MRGFKQEIFNQKTLEELYQKQHNEAYGSSMVLTSKKQYTVWARSKFATVSLAYDKARKIPNAYIGMYRGKQVYLCITPKASKFNSKKVKADGYTFDSKSEYDFYLKLKNDPEVQIMEIHPKHTLMHGFTDNKGYKHRPIEYECDFAYKKGGILYFVDVKGLETELFKVKWKMFVSYMHSVDPAIICQAIDSKGRDKRLPTQPHKRKTA